MLDTALIVLFLTLVLATVFFLIPEGGRWLSLRNRQRYRRLNERLAELSDELRGMAERLRPYRELQAPAYRRYYAAARTHMQTSEVGYRHLRQEMPRLSLPQVQSGLWAFPHFLKFPRHVTAIPRDRRLLGQMEQQVLEARRELARAREILANLDKVPDRLALDSQHLTEEWLPHLAEQLDAERAAGITALSDLESRLEALQRQGSALRQRLEPTGEASLVATDALARQLQGVRAAARELEGDMAQVATARQALDEEITLLEATGLGPEPEPETEGIVTPQVEPEVAEQAEPGDEAEAQPEDEAAAEETTGHALPALPKRGGLLQEEAAAHLQSARACRATLTFGQARRHLQSARVLLETGEVLEQVTPAVEEAETHEGAADLASRLEVLREEGRVLLRRVREQGAEQPLPEPLLQEMVGLGERASALATDARRRLNAWRKSLQRWQERAAASRRALQAAVADLEAVYPLPADDPLRAPIAAIEEEAERLEDDPEAWRVLAEETADLASEWQRLTVALVEGVEALELYRSEANALVDDAHAAADPWKSLHPLLSEMETAAMRLWQVQLEGSVAQVLDRLDEAYVAYSELLDSYDRLAAAYEPLVSLEERLDQLYLVAEEILPPERLQAYLGEATAHADAAQVAESVEQAMAHLQQAAAVMEEAVGE